MNIPKLGHEAGRGTGAFRATLVLLGLWALLALAQCSQGHPSWRYVSSEVVIPRKETHHGKGFRVPGWLSYSLHFGGQRYVIHLRRKALFWPRHLLVTTQDEQGALQMDYPYVPSDCYYLGYLEEIPLSMVTVDMCYGGLQGIMKLDDLAYEIKPLKDSLSFEHVVSQITAERDAVGPMYSLGHREDADALLPAAHTASTARISTTTYASHAGRIRGQVQCSYLMYQVYNNMTFIVRFLVHMFNMVDSYFSSLHVTYTIFLLTIYNVRDPFLIDIRVPDGEAFEYYSRHFRIPYGITSSTVVNKNYPHEGSYEPPHSTMCRNENLIFVASLGRHFVFLSTVAANEIMRNYGVSYDEPECTCLRRTICIMDRFPLLTDRFSNCSLVDMNNIAMRASGKCLFPPYRESLNKSLTFVRCGNNVVEDQEQCDCGSLKQCYHTDCCDTNCHLTPGSQCYVGSCCTNCTYSALGTLCRPMQTTCDLPEYCTSGSQNCPEDFYLQDGTPCSQVGYCYHGNCTDRSIHCKEIFGPDAEDGSSDCYDINMESHRFGHCSREEDSNTYQPCTIENRMCGRLQCRNVTRLPQLQDHVSFHQSMTSTGTVCFGLDEHRSTGTNDAGRVRPGTLCAPGTICVNGQCSGPVEDLNYDCTPQKCNYRGVCNNNRNCHCHVGWDPPLCLRRGFGGSADSGPPPKRFREVKLSEQSVFYLQVAVGRFFALLAALLFGVATNVRIILVGKEAEESESDE
ncbi:disintegrin and metalloproteinase domain-containing protein 21-like, partial [Otolemur garnettii]|uniref:disintegrin and metalloproteinase domain-containing protein 21-like n=1 Tax=Otolemur garnettii TaxID=30611 RepID=UPI000C7F5C2F